MAKGAANQISALLGERKFSRDAANPVGSEQLPLLAHKKDRRTRDDK